MYSTVNCVNNNIFNVTVYTQQYTLLSLILILDLTMNMITIVNIKIYTAFYYIDHIHVYSSHI